MDFTVTSDLQFRGLLWPLPGGKVKGLIHSRVFATEALHSAGIFKSYVVLA